MKLYKSILKKIVATILVIVMLISQINVIDVKANINNKITSITTLE